MTRPTWQRARILERALNKHGQVVWEADAAPYLWPLDGRCWVLCQPPARYGAEDEREPTDVPLHVSNLCAPDGQPIAFPPMALELLGTEVDFAEGVAPVWLTARRVAA